MTRSQVFGRMLKLRIDRPQPDTLEFTNSEPRSDYQAWCRKYPSYDALFKAAETSVLSQLPQ